MAAVMKRLSPGGRFYATWFDNPNPSAFEPIDRGGFLTYPDAEPYHYPFEMLAGICDAIGAHAERLDDRAAGGSHPRGESLMLITPTR